MPNARTSAASKRGQCGSARSVPHSAWEHGGPRVTFRELELPRKEKNPTPMKNLLALNEHQADPGVWLEA